MQEVLKTKTNERGSQIRHRQVLPNECKELSLSILCILKFGILQDFINRVDQIWYNSGSDKSDYWVGKYPRGPQVRQQRYRPSGSWIKKYLVIKYKKSISIKNTKPNSMKNLNWTKRSKPEGAIKVLPFCFQYKNIWSARYFQRSLLILGVT